MTLFVLCWKRKIVDLLLWTVSRLENRPSWPFSSLVEIVSDVVLDKRIDNRRITTCFYSCTFHREIEKDQEKKDKRKIVFLINNVLSVCSNFKDQTSVFFGFSWNPKMEKEKIKNPTIVSNLQRNQFFDGVIYFGTFAYRRVWWEGPETQGMVFGHLSLTLSDPSPRPCPSSSFDPRPRRWHQLQSSRSSVM